MSEPLNPELEAQLDRWAENRHAAMLARGEKETFSYPMDLTRFPPPPEGHVYVATNDDGSCRVRAWRHGPNGEFIPVSVQVDWEHGHGVTVGPDGIGYEVNLEAQRTNSPRRRGTLTSPSPQPPIADLNHAIKRIWGKVVDDFKQALWAPKNKPYYRQFEKRRKK